MAKKPLENRLVWSHSRAHGWAHGCKRAYWFQYYGSWGGWETGATERQRATWVQKKLTTRAAWTGTLVHEVAERWIKAVRYGEPVGLEDARNWLAGRGRADVEESESGEWLERPAKRVGFREHYYGEPVEPSDWDEALAEMDRQVVNLSEQRLFRRLLAVPERVREVEELRDFLVGEDPVYASLDVLVEDGCGGAVILDWKTGQHHDNAVIGAQLGVYGLYATQVLGFPEDRIVAIHVNLRHGTETVHRVDPAAIALARETLARDMAGMRGELADVAANRAEAEAFPPLAEGAEACGRCNFRGVCGRA